MKFDMEAEISRDARRVLMQHPEIGPADVGKLVELMCTLDRRNVLADLEQGPLMCFHFPVRMIRGMPFVRSLYLGPHPEFVHRVRHINVHRPRVVSRAARLMFPASCEVRTWCNETLYVHTDRQRMTDWRMGARFVWTHGSPMCETCTERNEYLKQSANLIAECKGEDDEENP